MKVADVVSMSWTNLDRRKGRTALTCAGVIVGVAALVMMLSLGLGLERQVVGSLESEFALRTITVKASRTGSGKKRARRMDPLGMGAQSAPVTDEDLGKMETVQGVSVAQPYLFLFLTVDVEGEAGASETFPRFEIGGIRPEERGIYGEHLVAGSMWKPGERGCLVPLSLLQELFEEPDPPAFLGRTVNLSRGMGGSKKEAPEELSFPISGVLNSAKLSRMYGQRVFLPMDRALEVRRLTKGGSIPFFYKEGSYFAAEVRAESVEQAGAVTGRLEKAGYQVTSLGDIIKVIRVLFLVFEGFLFCIGMIGLIVSLFGIANTMAMAVLERTREIGIMKALGARNRDIARVFLGEAAALGALGGVVGLALAVAGGFLLNLVARGLFELGPDISIFHVPLWLAVGSVVFSMFVSVLAGALPARRAAKMEPVAALRYE